MLILLLVLLVFVVSVDFEPGALIIPGIIVFMLFGPAIWDLLTGGWPFWIVWVVVVGLPMAIWFLVERRRELRKLGRHG